MNAPTQAGPDTVCRCGHWFEEHAGDGVCEACHYNDTLAAEEKCRAFVFSSEHNTIEAIADRGGDPERWPDWMKEAMR